MVTSRYTFAAVTLPFWLSVLDLIMLLHSPSELPVYNYSFLKADSHYNGTNIRIKGFM